MRKTILALALGFILFTTFSCGKDGDKPSSASIIGTWTTVSSSSKTYEGTSTTPTDEDTYNPLTDGVETTTFNANGTLTSTTILDGDTDTETGTYQYDAGSKKLTLISPDLPSGFPYDVKTLTSSSLVLHGEFTITDPTTNTKYKIVADASLKR